MKRVVDNPVACNSSKASHAAIDPMMDVRLRTTLMQFMRGMRGEKERRIGRLREECDLLTQDMSNCLAIDGQCMPSSLGESETVPMSLPVDYADELQERYLRLSDMTSGDRIRTFAADVSVLSRPPQLTLIASIITGDLLSSSGVISSIELDRDDRLFAIGGVSKKIKIFELANAVKQNHVVDHHCPVREISSGTKISCLSWNPYLSHQLASADYEGVISVYDTSTGERLLRFEEHEKRAWSVDFSNIDPSRLASGSDDCFVKVWSTKMARSCVTIDNRANVCSVRFSPINANLLAFGSAGMFHPECTFLDHHIRIYDLRKIDEPLNVLKGHKKAVSYVRFKGAEELLSAYSLIIEMFCRSTDNTIKLWSVSSSQVPGIKDNSECIKTYSGHLNEKNFIGLGNSMSHQFFACGSENNAVYVYGHHYSKPISSFHFNAQCPITVTSIFLISFAHL